MNPQVTSPPATAPAKPAGPGRPKDPGKRAAILDAAKRMFVSHGFERVSMDQIAAEAGVSKLTVYSHFGDKDRLFARVSYQHYTSEPERAPLPSQLAGTNDAPFLNIISASR